MVADHVSGADLGKAARTRAPRSGQADWEPLSDRQDPVEILVKQSSGRLPELVPLRYGRMSSSPFAFFRGAAAVMAADLAATVTSGIRVQLCGDAHVSNFGGYASPDRTLVFDLNDFDETLPGPWEWDVKRLVASLAIAGRQSGFKAKQRRRMVRSTARAYREAVREFAHLGNLDVWYSRLTVQDIRDRWGAVASRSALRTFERQVSKAMTKDNVRASTKLTRLVDGEPRFISSPPLIVPIEEIFGDEERETVEQSVQSALRDYRTSLAVDRRHLFDQFRFAGMTRKVVGVGSVGTRAWVILLLGLDSGDELFLQVKEASESVLAPYCGQSTFLNEGERVVQGQRLMQASSDIFLGWSRGPAVDGDPRDFYVRQLWDWKLSADIEEQSSKTLGINGQICGWTLARAHARSGDRVAIAAYLGSGDVFDVAMSDFAEAYADQNERDHARFLEAVADSRVDAITGV